MNGWWFFHVKDWMWLAAGPVALVLAFFVARSGLKHQERRDQERYDAITRRIYERKDG